MKSNSEKEKADLEKKLEATVSLLEQKEKDFQKQKAEVQYLVSLLSRHLMKVRILCEIVDFDLIMKHLVSTNR